MQIQKEKKRAREKGEKKMASSDNDFFVRIIWLQILPWEVFQKYPGSSLPPSDVLLIPLEEAHRPLSCFYQQKVILSRHPDRYVHKQNEIKQLKQKNLPKKPYTIFATTLVRENSNY